MNRDESEMQPLVLVLLVLVSSFSALAQGDPRRIAPLLDTKLHSSESVSVELRRYLIKKVPRMPQTTAAATWLRDASKLRERVLTEFVYRGWPQEWVTAPVKVEDLGTIPAHRGYRMRKLRYEVIPGFYAIAILYEPEELSGKVPAILNTNGHVGTAGKAVEYKQKRCINQALMGMIALNLEWPGMGELSQPENAHSFYAHLDLVGSSGLGLFYLTVRKALDYLSSHPHVDSERIGMTGLSGGGFQTILLSALDERVLVAVPVAGFTASTSRIERARDTGDIEHHASDLIATVDYPLLVALRAPRPTLLIYNAEDNCCYRAALQKPYIFNQVVPFFHLFGQQEAFAWYENKDPSTHNYQVDNRQQAYRFFTQHFKLPIAEKEIPVDSQIKSREELTVGLPAGSLSILGVARTLAEQVERPRIPEPGPARSAWADIERKKLKALIKYKPTSVQHVWPLTNTDGRGLETISYRFDFGNGLSATGIWLKATPVPTRAPAALVVHDSGKKSTSTEVSEFVNRGVQVLTVDPVFFGDEVPVDKGNHTYAQLLTGLGDRALGLEVSQLLALADWLQERTDGPITLETGGIRTHVLGRIAAALEPQLFAKVISKEGISSLRHLIEKPIEFRSAPDLFCFGLFREFDLARLEAMADTR